MEEPRYIDANKILYRNVGNRFMADREEINRMIPADVAPVIHAHWIVQKKPVYISSAEYPLCKRTKLYIPDFYTCSMCGRRESYQEPYCHCGAKMDEEE